MLLVTVFRVCSWCGSRTNWTRTYRDWLMPSSTSRRRYIHRDSCSSGSIIDFYHLASVLQSSNDLVFLAVIQLYFFFKVSLSFELRGSFQKIRIFYYLNFITCLRNTPLSQKVKRNLACLHVMWQVDDLLYKP